MAISDVLGDFAQQARQDLDNVYNSAHSKGYSEGKIDGIAEGYDKGVGDGYDNGRAQGLVEGENNGRMELINLITQNGTRTIYTRAFGAQDWSGFTFPKGMLNPKETREMFYDYRGKQLPKGIWCDRGQTSQTSTFGGSMFRYAYVLEEIYDMNLPPISNSMDHYFGDCYKLQKIEKLRVLESTTYNNPFNKCNALTYIRFEGTIANDISFQACPLDGESVDDIVTHLQHLGTDELPFGSRTIYLNADTWARYEAYLWEKYPDSFGDYAGAQDYVETNRGWATA